MHGIFSCFLILSIVIISPPFNKWIACHVPVLAIHIELFI